MRCNGGFVSLILAVILFEALGFAKYGNVMIEMVELLEKF